MAGWSTSTQRDRWIFTEEKLSELREKANASGAAMVKQAHERSAQQPKEGKEMVPVIPEAEVENGLPGKRKRSKDAGPEPLSQGEEREILKFYEWKIVEVCRVFRFPGKIQSTAMQYFKRFYLKHSVMEHDPKSIMLTVIYVACKIEEGYVSAENFGKGINQEPQLVLDNELTVLQALNFDLICLGPLKPLMGFLSDWVAFAPELFPSGTESGKMPSTTEELKDLATRALPAVLVSDASLLYSPSLLALAALTLGLGPNSPRHHMLPDLKSYLSTIGRRAAGSNPPHDVQNCVERIVALTERDGKHLNPEEEGRVKKIDRKLRCCKDPALRQDELRKKKEKKEQKEQAKAKRASHEPSLGSVQVKTNGTAPARAEFQHPNSETLDEQEKEAAKRRRSAGVVLK